MDDDRRNSEIERLANQMVHDGLAVDEQDESRLARYRDQVMADCGLDGEESMRLVYEALLYRKMKHTDAHDYLERGNEFGAGFS